MKEMFSPFKVRQSVRDDICPMMMKLLGSEDERSQLGNQRNLVFSQEGTTYTLKPTTPEEERAIFEEKSEPPSKLLIEGLKNLDVSTASKEKCRLGQQTIKLMDLLPGY